MTWWRTPGQPDPELPPGVRSRVADIARTLGADRVVLESPGGDVFRFARAGVCAGCGEPALRSTARVEQAGGSRAVGHIGAVRNAVERPWRACRRRGCWSREVMACMAVLAFAGRLRGVEVEWPWARRAAAPVPKRAEELTDAEWVARVAANMRTQKQYSERIRIKR